MRSVHIIILFVGLAIAHQLYANKPVLQVQGESKWIVPEQQAKQQNPVPFNKSTIDQGRQLYQQHCAACHGINADGQSFSAAMMQPKPSNLRAIAGIVTDGNLAYKITNGRGLMPEWGSVLTEKQIWTLVNFIQSLGR